MTSKRRRCNVTTSHRRHFLILKSDNIENSRIEFKGIVLQIRSNQIKVTFIIILPFNLVHLSFFPVSHRNWRKMWVDYWGAKGYVAPPPPPPPSQIIGMGPAPPSPLPTPMFLKNIQCLVRWQRKKSLMSCVVYLVMTIGSKFIDTYWLVYIWWSKILLLKYFGHGLDMHVNMWLWPLSKSPGYGPYEVGQKVNSGSCGYESSK